MCGKCVRSLRCDVGFVVLGLAGKMPVGNLATCVRYRYSAMDISYRIP